MNKPSNQHWDLVGDIHGEREALELLLAKLGYREEGGVISHPGGRKLLFLGDYIDRGPDSRGVLHLVRRLVDSGMALAILGNHEFNFIAWHTKDESGRYLRSHSEDHARQVAETLGSFAGYEAEIPEWVEWMKGLPFFVDLGDLRAVHAAWVPGDIAFLAGRSLMDRDFLIEANRRESEAWHAVGKVVKGVELRMPKGVTLVDSNRIVRKDMRVRWWGSIAGLTWEEIAFPLRPGLPEGPADLRGLDGILAYGPEEPPVFFGHYKLIDYPVAPQAANVASLDFGLGHGGPATAYRWDGERVIDPARFVQTPVFKVFVDDNFAYMDEDARSFAGRFYDFDRALELAKRIVDRSLAENLQPGMSAEALVDHYESFGDDAFVIPTPEGVKPFSAWDYAKERAGEMIVQLHGLKDEVSRQA
jgi:hypothetical protein